MTKASTVQEEHLHSLSPSPRQTLRCQMKLNTNIPKWLSHRAGLFGNTGSSVLFHLTKASRSLRPKGQTEFHRTNQTLMVKTQTHPRMSRPAAAAAVRWARHAPLCSSGGCGRRVEVGNLPAAPSTTSLKGTDLSIKRVAAY